MSPRAYHVFFLMALFLKPIHNWSYYSGELEDQSNNKNNTNHALSYWDWNYDVDFGRCSGLGNPYSVRNIRNNGEPFKRVYSELSITIKDHEISCVKISNRWRDGTGGQARLIKGGPEHKNMQLEFRSQVFRGYHFRVTIYVGPKRVTSKL